MNSSSIGRKRAADAPAGRILRGKKTLAALAAGANPELRIALSLAILRDALDCALVVSEAVARQAERATRDGETPFACACRRGHAALAFPGGASCQRNKPPLSPRRLSGPAPLSGGVHTWLNF